MARGEPPRQWCIPKAIFNTSRTILFSISHLMIVSLSGWDAGVQTVLLHGYGYRLPYRPKRRLELHYHGASVPIEERAPV